MTKPEVYLIDGSAYIYRAYHAVRPLSTSNGVPTHAVFGFTSILRKLISEKNPEYLAIAFDTRGPVFRHEIYADYKANRPPMPDDLAAQIPYIKSLVEAYNILSLEDNDQEADDLIAAAVKAMTDKGFRVVIVSGDKDLLQLVSDQVSLWDPMNDRMMDVPAVEKKYGVNPEALLHYFALTGDSSDNIPGVPGVGPKTAQKLIEKYLTLESLYDDTGSLKPSKMTERIIAHRDDAFLSRDLIRLNSDAEVPRDPAAYAVKGADNEKLRALFTELEFHSFLKNEVDSVGIDTENFFCVQTEKQLDKLCSQLKAASQVVIDTETDSLDPRKALLVGLSLCVDDTSAWYIPCNHQDSEGNRLEGQLELQLLLEKLKPILCDPAVKKVGHNLKYDFAVLASQVNHGIRLAGPLHDTMIGAWMIDPGRRSYKLDDLCEEIGLRLTSFSDVVKGDKRDDAFVRVGLEEAANYSCEDVYGSYRLYAEQVGFLDEMGVTEQFLQVEGPLVPVLADMEAAGIIVDEEVLAVLAKEFGERLETIEQEIYQAAGKPFNIQSPKQLGEILFVELGLPKGRKTKTGWSTDVKVLEKLALQHELPALILAYRNLAKLKSTYVDKLAELRDPVTGRVHTSYNQCGTATGRLSSSKPNLQNIPIRTEEGRRIRSAFVAGPGCSLLSGDYSQIDLRVMAHYSQDPALVEAFEKGDDIHRRTASQLFGVSVELVTSEMRRVAKTINFGIVYGMSSYGLAGQLDVSRKEAQAFIDRYFDHFSGIKEFMERIISQARDAGFVTTLTGRRRFVPEIDSRNRTRREFAERIAINTPVQGTAADIMKIAMLKVADQLKLRALEARMILQIHDELVLEVPDSELAQVSELLKTCMESVKIIDIPLVVNLNESQNLGKK